MSKMELTPIIIGLIIGFFSAVVGIRLHGFYKECKIENANRLISCVLQKDNLE